MSKEKILKFDIPIHLESEKASAQLMFKKAHIAYETEDRLFLEYQQGKTESFSELFKITRPWLFKMIYRIVNNRAEAEDILQETWVKMLQHVHKYNPNKGKVCNLIFTIAKNFALQSKRRSAQMVSLDSTEERYVDLNNDLQIQELCEMIKKIISEMKNPNHQDAVMMFYYADLEVKDIAKRMNTNEQNIKNWLLRSRKKIENELKNHKEYNSLHETIMSMFGLTILTMLNGNVL